MIDVEGLTKKFDKDGEAVLEDISFSLNAGDSLAVIGPSGCGKTTLLAIMAGLIPATAGTVRIQGNRGRPGKTSIILQDLRTVSLEDPGGKCGPWHEDPEHACRGPGRQNQSASLGAEPGPLCPSLSGSAQRRAEAAGRHCQSHCHGAGHPVDGRAVFVPGCHHPRTPADRHEGHVAEKQIDFCHRYPQC